MSPYRLPRSRYAGFVVLILLVVASRPAAALTGRAILLGSYTEPQNPDAGRYSKGGWGGGLLGSLTLDPKWKISAVTLSFDYIDLMSKSVDRIDRTTLLRTTIHTNQNIIRVMLGGEVGSHSAGFVRPHAGAAIGVVSYNFSTYLTVPNDNPDGEEIRQDLASETKTRFGYDLSLGLDLNIANRVVVEGGVRYLKSFDVPQQLSAAEAVDIYPDYFQIYIGVGASFNTER